MGELIETKRREFQTIRGAETKIRERERDKIAERDRDRDRQTERGERGKKKAAYSLISGALAVGYWNQTFL